MQADSSSSSWLQYATLFDQVLFSCAVQDVQRYSKDCVCYAYKGFVSKIVYLNSNVCLLLVKSDTISLSRLIVYNLRSTSIAVAAAGSELMHHIVAHLIRPEQQQLPQAHSQQPSAAHQQSCLHCLAL
jgi:hypothetical protein